MENKCVFCGTNNIYIQNYENYTFHECPQCGRYLLPFSSIALFMNHYDKKDTNLSKFASYMFYNKVDNRSFFVGSKEAFESYTKEAPNSTAMILTYDIVEQWYPKSFSDKIDLILLKLSEMSNYDGDYIDIGNNRNSLFLTINRKSANITGKGDRVIQAEYIQKYLEEQLYIKPVNGAYVVQLLPKALDRIYELGKSGRNNKKAFIAMSFADDYKPVMQAIKQAIAECGYTPLPICDVEHNNWIVPEIFHAIKQSRFVVVDLSAHNNGAYYESGYAEGIGKTVIHLCSEQTFNDGTHFDVKQKATIIWKDIDDLIPKLKARIGATLGD
jgi:hypothetical protein